MIDRIRFDDVLWQSGDTKLHGKELDRFKMHIDWCGGIDVPLTPAVLCQEMDEFPEGIVYLKQLIDQGVVMDLHGWDHGPYAPRTQDEVESHLEQSFEWFEENLQTTPVRWVTPHGANSRSMINAARKYNLTIETTEDPVVDQREADKILRVTRDLSKLNGKVIMVHWWERGNALYRIAQVARHGTVDRAIMASSADMDERALSQVWGKGWERLT